MTKAYAQSLVGASLSSSDGSIVEIQDNAVLSIGDINDFTNIKIDSLNAQIYQTGNSGLNLRSALDLGLEGGALFLYPNY